MSDDTEHERLQPTMPAVATHAPSRWLDALLWAGWIGGLGLGGLTILYAAPALAPSNHLNAVATPGLLTWVVTWPFRVTLFGAFLVAFMLRLREHRSVPAGERLPTLHRLLVAHSDPIALGVLCVVVIGGVRELMQVELYDREYGRNLFVALPRAHDLLSAAVTSAGALCAFVAMAVPRSASGSAERGASAPLTGPTTIAVSLLLIAIWPRAALFPAWSPQDRHMEALTMNAIIWELMVAGFVLAADDPLARGVTWSQWVARNLPPLRLLVMLELLRVAGRQEWYLDMQWLPPHGEHGAERLFFFDGRFENLVVVGWRSLLLAVGVSVLWFHLVRRKASDAALDGKAR